MKSIVVWVGLWAMGLGVFGVAESAAGQELELSERLAYAARFDDSKDDKKTSREAADLWQGIETSSWPDALNSFKARFKAERSYLTLFKKIPREPMDMRSPDRFKRSMSSNELTNKSSIGHMAIGWSCSSQGESRSEGFAAQTGEDGQQPEMLNNGWGVTALVSTFTDGRLQNGGEVQRYFATGYRKGIGEGKLDSFFALVVELPFTDCEQVRSFVKNYVFHPAKPYRNFGMQPDPLKFEGAGCGSFAIAALSNSPSLAPIMSSFWRTVPIAEKLLGRRIRVQLPNEVIPFVFAKTAADEHDISKYRLVLMNWDSGKTAVTLRIVDPELTIYSLKKIAATAVAKQSGSTRFQMEHLKPLRRVYNFPSKGDDSSINDKDSGLQEIDAAFDPSFERVSAAVDQWWNGREATSQINLISFPLGVGVMIESK